MNLRRFCDLWARPWPRRIMIGFAAAAILYVSFSAVERALFGSSEFHGYRQIVQVSVIEDADHYVEIEHLRAYPPFFAIFWLPFGLLPVGAAEKAEYAAALMSTAQRIQFGASATALALVGTLGTLVVVRWVAGSCRREGAPAGSCHPALIWLMTGGLMLNAVGRSHTDMVILLLIAGAMHLLFARRRPWLAGGLLGVAAAAKLTPGLFGVYLLCRRKWRAAGGMIAAGFVCSVVLPLMVWGFDGTVQRYRSWVEKVLLPLAQEGAGPVIGRAYRSTNQSLKAATVRYLSRYNAGRSRDPRYVNIADLPEQAAARIATGLKVIVLGLLLAAWLLPRSDPEGEKGPLLFALVAPGMLLLSDVSVGAHLVALSLPAGAVTGYCLAHAETAMARRVGSAAVAGAVLANLIAVGRLKQLSVGTAGILVLFAACLWLAFGKAGEGEGASAVLPSETPSQ